MKYQLGRNAVKSNQIPAAIAIFFVIAILVAAVMLVTGLFQLVWGIFHTLAGLVIIVALAGLVYLAVRRKLSQR